MVANRLRKISWERFIADVFSLGLKSNQQMSTWGSDMNRMRAGILLSAAGIGMALTSCGGSSRQLESIALSPDPATAKNGTVQLVAAGTFSSSPLTVTPLQVNWNQNNCVSNVCPQALVIGPVTVNQSGVASCAKGYSGTAMVHASAPKDPTQPPDATGVPLVTGTTSVVCP
jgi:hypothetical protein